MKFKNTRLKNNFAALLFAFFSFSTAALDVKPLDQTSLTFETYKSKRHNEQIIPRKYLDKLNVLPYHNVLETVNKKDSSLYLSPFENNSIILMSKDKEFQKDDLNKNELSFFNKYFSSIEIAKNNNITYSFINVHNLSFFDLFTEDYQIEYNFLKSLYDSNIRVSDLVTFSNSERELKFYKSAFVSINAMIQLTADRNLNATEIENNFQPLLSKNSRNIEIIAVQYIIRHIDEIHKINNYKDTVKLTKSIIKNGMSALYQSVYDGAKNNLTTKQIQESFYTLFSLDNENKVDEFYLSNPILRNIIVSYFKDNKQSIPNKFEYEKNLVNNLTTDTTFKTLIKKKDQLNLFDNTNSFYYKLVTKKIKSEYLRQLNNPNNLFSIMEESLIIYGSYELDNKISCGYKNYNENDFSYYINDKGSMIKIIS